jgi:hypothetical protein
MKTPTPKAPRSRGIEGVQKPGKGAQKSSGIGDLRNPRVAGQAPQKAIAPAEEQVIKGMETKGEDGTTAGADGLAQNPNTAPGSQGNIPAEYRGAIVPPSGWHVP